MSPLHLCLQMSVLLVCVQTCVALFYTNNKYEVNKDSEYPRLGKRSRVSQYLRSWFGNKLSQLDPTFTLYDEIVDVTMRGTKLDSVKEDHHYCDWTPVIYQVTPDIRTSEGDKLYGSADKPSKEETYKNLNKWRDIIFK